MTARLFSQRKIVRAVKENMTRMCSTNWKCILSSGDVWGRTRGLERMRREAGMGELGLGCLRLGGTSGAVKGPFLADRNVSAQSPPSPTAF